MADSSKQSLVICATSEGLSSRIGLSASRCFTLKCINIVASLGEEMKVTEPRAVVLYTSAVVRMQCKDIEETMR